MNWRAIAYNSVTVSLPKNAMQYLLGLVIFFLMFGSFDLRLSVTGFIGFILAYCSVYIYNDIVDAPDDAKNPKKIPWKPIANGAISARSAALAGLFLLVAGLAVSFTAGLLFSCAIGLMLLLNLLHSWPRVGMKRNLPAASINITAIEFLKFSSGWLAVGGLAFFPAWLFLMLALAYSIGYTMYRLGFDVRLMAENRVLLASVGVVWIVLYAASLLLYGFKTKLIISLVPLLLVLAFTVILGQKGKMQSFVGMECALLAAVLLVFLFV